MGLLLQGYNPLATNATNAETASNGFSNVFQTGDTINLANGNFIIVPGVSKANYSPTVLGCTNVQACNCNAASVPPTMHRYRIHSHSFFFICVLMLLFA